MKLGPLFSLFLLLASCCPSNKSDRSAASVEAIRQLRERDRDVYEGGRIAGSNDVRAVGCSLINDYVTALSEVDAQLLSQIENLEVLRVLPLGGPPARFWDSLDQIGSLREFCPHYGLSEKGVRSLVKFPNLESLIIWGSGTWGERTHLEFLPYLKHLRILHLEESEITDADIQRVKECCPALVEFLCERDLTAEQLEMLRSLPNLTELSAANFLMENGVDESS